MSVSKTYVKSKKVYKVSFILPKEAAPAASEVRVLGEFNNWDWDSAPVMKATKKEYKLELKLEAGRAYEFRYLTAEGEWLNDWSADYYQPIEMYAIDNCVVDLTAIPETAKPKAKTPAAKKKTTKAKKTSKKVDFKKIEGVGPKIAGLLADAGYDSYSALANAEISALKEILDKAGSRYRMHDPTTWPLQADLLAEGKTEELKALQEELKGGKVTA